MANAFTLFGEIKVDTDKFRRDLGQAETKLKSVHREVETVERSATGLGTSFSRLSGHALAAGAAIAAVSASAIAAGAAIFRLLKTTSDFGSAVFEASQKTGLTTKTISALKYAAEQSGSSMEKIVGSVAKFNVLLGEANWNKKAADTLKSFGVTARDADEALRQAIESIAKETDVTKQAAAAKALFKDRMAEILPVIASFNGNLPELMAKLEKMELLMGTDAAQASDAFGDALKDLEEQAAAAGRAFALELMPMVTQAMQGISQWMTANRGQATAWANALMEAAGGIRVIFKALEFQVKLSLGVIDSAFGTTASKTVSAATIIREAILNMIPPLMLLRQLQQQFGSVGDTVTSGVNSTVDSITGMTPPPMPSISMPNIAGGNSRGGASTADAAAREAARRAEREASAQLQVAEFSLRDALRVHSDFVKNVVKDMGSYWSLATSQYTQAVSQIDIYTNSIQAAVQAMTDLEDATLRPGMTVSESANLDQKQEERWREASEMVQENIARFQSAVSKAQQDLADGVIDSMRDFSERARGGIDSLSESVKAELEQIKVAWDELDAGMEPPAIEKWSFFWYTMKQGIKDFKESLPSLKQSLGENLLNTLYSIGDVFAQAVMQWDGTAKGFFKSLAQGFRQLISQLIAELIRLMVMKMVLQLIGAIAGGASNPATNGAGLGAGFGNPVLNGTGGFGGAAASGIGGGVANAIAGGFAAPAMAMGGGGSVANSTFNNSVTVNLAGGGGSAQTAEQVARVVMLKLSQMQNRNK